MLTANGADVEADDRRDATGRRWRMTQVATDAQGAWWPGIMADVAAAVARRSAAVSGDVYGVILREVPQLRDDTPVLALLASSVDSNVDTCLQIMQHRIDLAAVQAPAAATEYARRLAQRGTPLTALLRAYRLGHARFSDWVLRELAQQAGDAYLISAAALGMSGIVAGYIDQVSEEMVAAYTRERESWLLNRSAARGARIHHLLSGEPVDVGAAEAMLGYRLCPYHVGLPGWSMLSAASRRRRAPSCCGRPRVVLREGPDAGDGPADDESLHRLGALEGVDRLHVHHVPHDLVVEQNAVAAEHVARLGGYRAGLAGVVHLGQPGHSGGQPARLGQAADLQAVQLHRGEVRQHRHQPLLDDLEASQRLAELAPLLRVPQGGVVGGGGVA